MRRSQSLSDALGEYHLVQQIGTGGMGSIWLAVRARDGAVVAIKRMRPQLGDDVELRHAFIDEATLGLRLQHPNIVETLELGKISTEAGDELYLVLELMCGRPLVEVLRTAQRRASPVPIAVAMRVMIDVARGLDHAHRLRNADGDPLGVVHRDVSPHNVFVCSSGVAKIFDFGIAKSKEQQHATSPGGMKGKLHYLAPEQLHGHAPDARFDVFALGIVLHEVLTGEPLFHGENDAETLHALLTRYVPPPELMRGDVPSGLGAIVLRALQREPDRRLPTAGAMADALEAVAEAEGIELSTSAVRGFMAALFPNDRALDAQRLDAAKRVYDAVVPVAPALVPLALPRRTPRRRSGWARAAVVLGAMSFAVFAAASAAHFLAPRPSTPVVEAVAAPPVRAAPVAASVVAELEGTSSLLREPSDPSGLPARKPASPLKRRFHVSDGCSVYISITKGGPTMVCPKGSTKRARR